MKNRFEETYFSRQHRYSMGKDHKEGGCYLAIPVSNGVVDYDEQYGLTLGEYERYLGDEEAALRFVRECRRREHDNLLIYPPGTSRGTPV